MDENSIPWTLAPGDEFPFGSLDNARQGIPIGPENFVKCLNYRAEAILHTVSWSREMVLKGMNGVKGDPPQASP
jgi:hypothetical protein